MKLEIDQQRLVSEIESLAAFSDAEPPAVTRIVFTPTERKARAWVKDLCKQAALGIRDDAAGNTFARWEGSDRQAPAVGTGSHIDAVPNAGKYDGVVGVLGGLEAIRALQKAGLHPRHSIDLLVFASEEPTRFGIGCLGSRLLSGTLAPAAARALRDGDNKSIDDVRSGAGLPGRLEDVSLPRDYYKAFVELHIEQGPLLERQGKQLGVVERIAAPASARITIEGAGGHAGGVLMPDRHDALCAAAELILSLEHAARSTGAVDTVATVGMCDVFPGAVNSIPARVLLSVDVRDTSLERRNDVMQQLDDASRKIASKRGVEIYSQLLNADAPAECDAGIIASLDRACQKHGLDSMRVTSRAYHDSLFMSRIAPMGMLFIPCHNGYSHRPDEYASPEDIAGGTLVLAEILAALAE
ncbi:MAG TPA: M20 family metallo-hydrolase [Candidatus Solibacter sp.]|nr:M20 family metallo-hydrolase [Candidatus Solibacter sp.]